MVSKSASKAAILKTYVLAVNWLQLLEVFEA